MDCPNCYANGLAPRSVRCPRCDWLLLEQPSAGSSAAFATPPVANPWSVSARPELPAFPAEPAPDHQMSALWGSAGVGLPVDPAGKLAQAAETPGERVVALSQARPSTGAPESSVPDLVRSTQGQRSAAPALGSQQPLPPSIERSSLAPGQRLTLLLRALSSLGPLLLLLVLALTKITALSSFLRTIDAPAGLSALVGAALVGLVVLRFFTNVPLVLDGLSGELRQEVLGVSRRTLTGVRFEQLGAVRLADQRLLNGVRQGGKYRVRYSPLSKTVWAIEAVSAPQGR